MKLTFQALPVTLDAAAGDDSPRTITGVAVPYNVPAVVMSGEKVIVRPGAFDTESRPKLLEGHDMTQLRGTAELVDSDDALLFEAKFAKTRAADDAIELVKAGAYDSVSAGFTPTRYKFDKKGTLIVEAAEIHEISLVAMPAWKQAVITEIAASSPEDDESPTDTTVPEEEPTVNNNQPTVEAAEPETVPTSPIVYAQARREFQLPSASEYVATFLKGGADWATMQARIMAGAPDVLTSDLDGILPVPIVQPVYNGLIGRRNVIDAIGAKAMPQGGKVFIRPSVTTHTSIAAVTENNNNIQSGTFVVTDNQVTKAQYGGYVEVSQFSIDTTQPEVISLLLDDMARVYAKQTETAVETALEAGITATQPAFDVTDPAAWADFVYDCSAAVLNSSSHLPTHLFMSPSFWAALGKLSDTADRPLFPQVGPMNAYGNVSPNTLVGNAFGLTCVVTPYNSDFLAVGNADGFEIFEDLRGSLQVTVPNQLSRTIAWYGYLATLMIDADKFVKIA